MLKWAKKKNVQKVSNVWIEDENEKNNESKTKKNKSKKNGSNPWMQEDNDNTENIKVNIDVKKLEEKNPEVKEKNQFNLISNNTEEQKELIKRAFANDDVEASFEQEKKGSNKRNDTRRYRF